MTATVSKIDDYPTFWLDVVRPDYLDTVAEPANLRRAFHCAISLFHMADWVYVAHKSNIDAAFTFVDKNGTTRPVQDEKTFANALRDLHPDFDLIRGIANSAKHLQLKQPGPHPAAPSHAANTQVQATGWGQGAFGAGPYGGTPRVMLQGPKGNDLEFSVLAKSVLDMWTTLADRHGWQIV
jgi:hypothetical protein